jgi:hypothetical protein
MSQTRKDTDNLTTEEWSNQDLRDLAEEAFAAGDDEQARMCAEELRQRGSEVEAEDIERILTLREFGHGPSPSPSVLIQGRREAWVREYLDPNNLLTEQEVQDDEQLRGALRECGFPTELPWDAS